MKNHKGIILVKKEKSVKNRAKKHKKGEKRVRILDGALKVFAEKGFYFAKISEIAKKAGVADGTIYLYFDNKDDILISLFEERMEMLISAFLNAITGVEGILEKIRIYIDHHLELINNIDLARILTIELRQSTRFMKNYRNQKFVEYLGLLEALIEQGQQQGLIRKDTPAHWIGRMIFGALDELLLAFCSHYKQVDEPAFRKLSEKLSDILIQGISTKKEFGNNLAEESE